MAEEADVKPRPDEQGAAPEDGGAPAEQAAVETLQQTGGEAAPRAPEPDAGSEVPAPRVTPEAAPSAAEEAVVGGATAASATPATVPADACVDQPSAAPVPEGAQMPPPSAVPAGVAAAAVAAAAAAAGSNAAAEGAGEGLMGTAGATLNMLPTNPNLFMRAAAANMQPVYQPGAVPGQQAGALALQASATGPALPAGVPTPATLGGAALPAPGAGGPVVPAAAGAQTVAGLPATSGGVEQSPMLAQNDQSFVCNICRKSFKREMNLIFHMTTHRQRQTVEGVGEIQNSNAPVKCSDCPKVFATKYQAKKHFLRRHFKGERPYKCRKCNKKAFTVKEDLTMHMKACGQVFTCSCGIRLCSLGALKRHAKYFKHEPTNWEGTPVHGDFMMRGAGMEGVDVLGMPGHDKGDDDSDDDGDDGAMGQAGAKDQQRGVMPGVDMADGAAAHALLMADASRGGAHFEHPGAGAAPGTMPMPQLWQVQHQAAGNVSAAQMAPDIMRQQMQLQHHLAHQLNQQQQLQNALLAQHPQLQLGHYNPAALQHAMATQGNALAYLPPGMSMPPQQAAYGARLSTGNAAQTAAASAAVDIVAAAPSMSCSLPESTHQLDANGMFVNPPDFNGGGLTLAAANGQQAE
mmetsp:Transcript_14898/g.36240  ORF Transcript_14898/g.36240 Transcript_14898/m.36240 type:complete len:633 (-) Transcript_14898:911-2809(-)